MPPRLSAFRRLLPISSKRPIGLVYCPACSYWRLSGAQRPLQDARQSTRLGPSSRARSSSKVASTTAINATREIPQNSRELHEALSELNSKAANYVNLSRLQLALRGLETEDAVIRVAVLGLNGQGAARRLIRILLADPLAPEQPWEKQLETIGEDDGRGLLIRYGEGLGTSPQSPLLSTIAIPSSTLRSHSLEILISSINTNIESTNSPASIFKSKEVFLVPTLETTGSAHGRFSMITYPVHKTLVFGEGVEDVVAYAGLAAGQTIREVSAGLVKVAFGMDMQKLNGRNSQVTVVNMAAAETAVNVFRESVNNSVAYEHGWLDSGMPTLAEWLVQGSQVTVGAIKPAVQALAESVLDDTAENISKEATRRSEEIVAAAVPDTTRQTLNQSLKGWAEQGHTELRDQLDLAFSSRRWRRLAWWKLFWRVDDVSMIASEVLERRWLVEAEKEIIWLAGRIKQAGFLENDRATFEPIDVLPPPRKQQTLGSPPPPPTLHDLVIKPDPDATNIPPMPPLHPWPMQIPLARLHLSTTTIPALQALAQRLVLQTLFTTTVTSALSALMYVSISTTSIYEAGAIAALGFVYSMRRLQKRWEGRRGKWEGEIREEGRKVLRETEGVVGGIVRMGGRLRMYEQEVEERMGAGEVVERARRALG